jgi:hypothetical protein
MASHARTKLDHRHLGAVVAALALAPVTGRAQGAPLQDTRIFTAPAGSPSALGGPTPSGEISIVRERSFAMTPPSMTGSGVALTAGNTARDGLFSQSIYFRTGPVLNNTRTPEAAFTVTLPAGVTVVGVVFADGTLAATNATWGLAPGVDYTSSATGVEAPASDVLTVAAGAGGTTVITVRTDMNTSPFTDDFRVLLDYGAAFTPGLSMRVNVAVGDDVNVGGTNGGRSGTPTGYAVDVPLTLSCVTDQDMDRVPDCLDGTADLDRDGRPNYLDPDDDGDGVPTTNELGASATMASNTDAAVPPGQGTADAIPDWLDPDDDGDGLLTLDELGPGGFATARNTDAAVPAAAGTADAVADYLDADDDGDGIPTAVEIALDTTAGDDFDGDGIPSYRDTDSDADGIFDRVEGTRDANMNMRPDFLDPSDDSDMDGLPNTVERGGCMGTVAGCVMGDRDTDRDGVADWLDPDDDGDGIPTTIERALDPSMGDDFDMDAIPSYRDTDSDGDGDTDREEAGASPAIPVNTDRAMDGPDFLDRDSDNDCAGDAVTSEDGAARITVAMDPNAACMDPTPVCDTSRGACVACVASAMGAGTGCVMNANGSRCLAGPSIDRNACGCATDADCPADRACNAERQRCETRPPTPDAGADAAVDGSSEVPVDASVADGGEMDATAPREGGMTTDGGASLDGGASIDASTGDGASVNPSLSGAGACACRAPAGPARGETSLAWVTCAALAAVGVRRARRR